MGTGKVRIGIVGLGFGAEFIPIYQRHPDAEMYAICRRNRKELDECGDKFGIAKRYTSYEDMLADPDLDAVHINSPIADHAPQAIAALKAGKHVASTVPAATSVDECRQLVEWQRKSGKVYMMMETVVYSREYLFVKELYDKGELGRIQFLRGSHQQDMEGWPGYWEGFPPMHYATHCVSPCLALLGKHAESVVCHGSGRIDEALIPKYGSPFAIETATFKFRDSDVCAEVTRSLFNVARQYRESFDAYGSKKSKVRSRSFTRRARPRTRSRRPRSRSACRYPTTRTCFLSRSSASRSQRPSRTPSTSRFCREVDTVDRIHTSCTTSCRPCSAARRRFPMSRRPSTGPWWASARTSRRSRAAKRSRFRRSEGLRVARGLRAGVMERGGGPYAMK
jgi:predicted dehydrogenase